VYPADVAVPSAEEAERRRNERRLASLGIARQKTRAMPMEPTHVGEAGVPAVVEGVKGEWRVDPAALGADFEGRTALLSPFDRLVHDRVRTQELFDFEYTLEMYKPAAKRRWGYFALPILHEDQLVGKLDAADRKASVLRGQRDPPGREVHAGDDEGGADRAGGPGVLARPERDRIELDQVQRSSIDPLRGLEIALACGAGHERRAPCVSRTTA
jgi:Winged helix DNA-binding domain